jgi:hypothetical protein
LISASPSQDKSAPLEMRSAFFCGIEQIVEECFSKSSDSALSLRSQQIGREFSCEKITLRSGLWQ